MVRTMELRPSDIHYSQDSILNRFGDYTDHGGVFLGETLDNLLQGYCNVNSIQRISVADINGQWFTADNRRLWVFRKAEELGFLNTIEVQQCKYIPDHKFTTKNGGTDIRVRGKPGGKIWKRWRPQRIPHNNQITRISDQYQQITIHNNFTSTPVESVCKGGYSSIAYWAHRGSSVTPPTSDTNSLNLSNRSHNYVVDLQTQVHPIDDSATFHHSIVDGQTSCHSTVNDLTPRQSIADSRSSNHSIVDGRTSHQSIVDGITSRHSTVNSQTPHHSTDDDQTPPHSVVDGRTSRHSTVDGRPFRHFIVDGRTSRHSTVDHQTQSDSNNCCCTIL